MTGQRSGLTRFVDLLNKNDYVQASITEFGLDDIVRSDTCAQLVRMFLSEGL